MLIEPKKVLAAFIATTLCSAVWGAVSADEAKQLGTTLTPWGAEKTGTKDGSIPAYTGEAIKTPAGFDPKKPGIRPDPFDSDKPLFSITAQNYAQYADKLSEGQKEMFKKLPSFRMDIYPSRRTANYPKYVQDNTVRNATTCKGDAKEERLLGCYGGVPFPIPKSGNQVMWNHLTAYKQTSWYGDFTSYVVTANGSVIPQAINVGTQDSEFYDPARTTPTTDKTVFFKIRIDLSGPARRSGEKQLFVNTMDQTNRVWTYIPGQRRVKLAPDLAYDTPNPQSGGSLTMDDSQIFFGQLDRFDFKLAGKKELYIPYNTYKANNPNICPAKKLWTAGFANPDCMRYELHRVWVVNATVKPGIRHVYSKRTFYYDEDMPGTGVMDDYDAGGKIYRVGFVAPYVYYEGPGMSSDNYIVVDLQTGIYGNAGFADNAAWHASPPKNPIFFSPEALAGEGIR